MFSTLHPLQATIIVGNSVGVKNKTCNTWVVFRQTKYTKNIDDRIFLTLLNDLKPCHLYVNLNILADEIIFCLMKNYGYYTRIRKVGLQELTVR